MVDKHVAVSAGAGYDSMALDMTKFGVYRRAAPGRQRCRSSKPKIDAVIADVVAQGRRRPRNSSAPRPG